MKTQSLLEAYELLKSPNPKIRMDAAVMAVEREFWLSEPPEWFSVNKHPDVIGFDSNKVIYGTNFKNIKMITWDELKNGNIYNEELVDSLIKKSA